MLESSRSLVGGFERVLNPSVGEVLLAQSCEAAMPRSNGDMLIREDWSSQEAALRRTAIVPRNVVNTNSLPEGDLTVSDPLSPVLSNEGHEIVELICLFFMGFDAWLLARSGTRVGAFEVESTCQQFHMSGVRFIPEPPLQRF